MIIALTYNIKPKKSDKSDEYAEFDSRETIDDLKNAITVGGHNVLLIEADELAYIKLKKNRDKIDFVFNFAEGLRGESRESQIPIFCELLNLPYLGAGPLSNAIILDKARTKEILTYYNISTPKFLKIENENRLNELDTNKFNLHFPLLVKLLSEGSSKGLKNENLVYDKIQLKKIIKKMIRKYKQKVIVEEFLGGREFTVSLIGNENPLILPLVEVKFDYLPPNLHRFDSYEAKWIYDSPEYIKKNNIQPIICPAEINKKLENKIKETALKTFKVFDCKDWARIDIRLDKNNIPNVLEINVPVGLLKNPDENSRMPKAAYAFGWTYEKLINEILNSGLRRYKK